MIEGITGNYILSNIQKYKGSINHEKFPNKNIHICIYCIVFVFEKNSPIVEKINLYFSLLILLK